MFFWFSILLIFAFALGENLDRQLLEFENLLQRHGLRFKKKKSVEEAVYAHRNVTLRVQYNHRVHFMSAWIVPRRDYRDNRRTLDFLSYA
ncbi:MAG: hypothetical protein D6804_07530, partial [Aquificota bacterium]